MIWPKPPSGNGPLSDQAATWFRQLLEGVKRCALQPGRGYRVKETSAGTFIELDIEPGTGRRGGSSAGIQLVTISEMGFDLMKCTTSGGSVVNVLKSPELRNSNTSEVIDGITHTFTYSTDFMSRTDITFNEGQVIIPRFRVGVQLAVMEIAPVSAKFNNSETSVSCTLLDLNIGARAWAVA